MMTMEARARRYGAQASPERTRVWVEPPSSNHPPQPHQGKKVPVVYYLCRNHHLEHPHFIEVPLSSAEGLYLRDVINRLNVLRGKGMPAMYSWSCKRSYKNGFVWHDLSEDDLILPAQGNEYILKGSELLDQSPPDRQLTCASNPKIENLRHLKQDSPNSVGIQKGCSSSSSPSVVIKEIKQPLASLPPPSPPLPPSPAVAVAREDEQCHTPQSGSSGNISPEPMTRVVPSSGTSSPSQIEFGVPKLTGAQDASTQTEDGVGKKTRGADTRIAGVSTDDGHLDAKFQESHHRRTMWSKNNSEIVPLSPVPTTLSASSRGRIDTLESLIKAEACKGNSFRILEEEEVFVPVGPRLKPSNLLMHLITCGSISVKDHRSFGLIPTYRPRFTQIGFPSPMFSTPLMMGDLSCRSESPRTMGLRLAEAEYFSGSLLETKKHKQELRLGVPNLKRSSSFGEDRTYKMPDAERETESLVDSVSSKCLPHTIKMISCKQSKDEAILSPASEARNSSARPESRASPLCSSKGASKRISDASSAKGSSMRLISFDEEKVIKIEERLASGARVIIQSTSLCDESDDSSDSL